MKRLHVSRPPKGLAYMDIDPEQVRLLDEQVRLILAHQLDTFNPRLPLDNQLRELARNCYLQGVLDGQQLFRNEYATGAA